MSTNLRFQRINSTIGDNFDFTKGTIYFNDADNLIYVGTGNGTGTSNYKVYSGARDINWDNANSILSFTNASGTSVSIDFDNLVGFDDFTALRDGIGLVESKVGDVSVYSFGANGIVGTEYLDSSDSSTVIGALKTLDDAVKVARQNAGVTSFEGKTGAITLAPTNETNGAINLSISGGDTSVLTASMYGINTAAYETKEYFVGIDGSTDASTNDTIKGAKKYTAEVLGTDTDTSAKATVYGVQAFAKDNLGKPGDTSAAITIYGARQKAADVKTELLGTVGDASTVKTIEGLTTKINEVNTNNTLHLYSGTEGTTEATHVTADGSTYRLVQGNTTVATFNIEKDSFVQDGSVRNFTTDEAAAAATGDPNAKAGHYIHLIIKTSDASSGAPAESNLWIPAESLVDAYDASNGDNNVIVTVDNTINKIWATTPVSDGTHLIQHNNTEVTLATIASQTVNAKIASLENTADNTAGGVKITETVTSGNAELNARIVDGAVTTAKIANGNVTEAKLSSDVSTKLNGAVQTVTGETAISNPNDNYINVKVSAAKTGTDVSLSTTYSLTIHDVSTATSSSNGLADASTVKTYVQTYVGEQLTWSAWPEA